nr:hypothetical protein [Clostridioides sp.]
MFWDFKLEDVAKTTVEQSGMHNCSIEDAWKEYIHPIITDKFTLNEVKEFINNDKE